MSAWVPLALAAAGSLLLVGGTLVLCPTLGTKADGSTTVETPERLAAYAFFSGLAMLLIAVLLPYVILGA